MEIFTNNTPSVAYLKRADTPLAKKRSDKINAAKVMAAGSVMNEPSKGTNIMTMK